MFFYNLLEIYANSNHGYRFEYSVHKNVEMDCLLQGQADWSELPNFVQFLTTVPATMQKKRKEFLQTNFA